MEYNKKREMIRDKDALDNEDVESKAIAQLLHTVYEKYGFDFREYSYAHLKRRIMNRVRLSGFCSIQELESKIASSDDIFAHLFLKDLSINVTEMYRDPDFYQVLREKVIPHLKTYSFFKIWHAGCSTGQEVYSMAILLKEEGIYDRALIYATDFNQEVLNHAQEGIYSDELIKEYTQNYQRAGGTASLSDYYTAGYSSVIMDQSLKKNIVWANHNLVTDHVFAEVNLIMCRNVLIYFNRTLQNKVHDLFYNSLAKGGFLCLGTKESLSYTSVDAKYQETSKPSRIYIKKY
jgi:chemotaxis protein methyltransferase CheR